MSKRMKSSGTRKADARKEKSGESTDETPDFEYAHQVAIDLAQSCHESSQMDHPPEAQARIWDCYRIGESLNQLATLEHKVKYQHKMEYKVSVVEVFINRWEELGGFSFGRGQAKYFRVVAETFKDRRLLNKALRAGIGWTGFRELSRPGVSPKLRRDIVDEVRAGKIPASEIARFIRSHKDYAPTIPAPMAAETAMRRANDLRKSSEDLDMALNRLTSKHRRKEIRDLCKGIREANRGLRNATGLWAEHVNAATAELRDVSRRIAKENAKRK